MKIVHVCLCGPVTDGWTYHDNQLSKYHKLLGHEVVIITSKWVFNDKGSIEYFDKSGYINPDGIKTIRLNSAWKTNVNSSFRKYDGLYGAIDQEEPDVIFVHACQFIDIREVAKYVKRHRNVILYADNHADFSNSARSFLSKWILHRIVYRSCVQSIRPYCRKFFGVLPARVDFLHTEYGVPYEQIELLVMGADDEKVKEAATEENKRVIREKVGLKADDFFIITGGKIDKAKTQTLLLMEAVKNIAKPKVKLVVFGSVEESLKDKVLSLSDGEKVKFIGWVKADDSYKFFAASNLVVFPGRHSVFWEQVVAQGIPMLVKRWAGTDHVDVNGNVHFINEDTVQTIQREIETIVDPEYYAKIKQLAVEASKDFMYSEIAKKSLSF